MHTVLRTIAVFATVALSAAFASCNTDNPEGDPSAKSVAVSTQNGPLRGGIAGTATFTIATTGIDDNKTGRVSWFTDEAGTVAGTTPAGISIDEFRTASGGATLTVNATAALVGGTYRFKVTIDGATSAVAILTVEDGLLAPSNLRTSSLLDESVVLEWDAVAEAESYIVRFEDATYPVDDLNYELYDLTPEKTYTWEVASVNGEMQSKWASGTFTTQKGDGRTKFVYVTGTWNEKVVREDGMVSVNLMFLDFDPVEGDTGTLLNLDVLLSPEDVDISKAIIDLPEGDYEFVSSDYYGTDNVVVLTAQTTMERIVDGKIDEKPAITDGTMTITGDNDRYLITFDVQYEGATTPDRYKYSGPILIGGTPQPQLYILGDMTFVNDKILYQLDFLGQGGEIDAWVCQAQTSGVGFSGSAYAGTGFILDKLQFIAPNGGVRPVPNGPHYVGPRIETGYISAGNIQLHPVTHAEQYRGLWIYHVTNGQFVRYPIVGGSVTSTYANGSYTMALDLEDVHGNTYRGTIRGKGVLEEIPAGQ